MLPSCKLLLFLVLFQFHWMTIFGQIPYVLIFRPEETLFPRAKIATTLINLREFTICFWYRPTSIAPNHNCVLDYEIPNSTYNELLIYFPRLSKVCIASDNPPVVFKCFPHDVPLLKWQHICFVWSSNDGVIFLYIDGQLTGNGTDFRANHTFKDGELYVGADQTTFGSNIFPNAFNSFGDIAEMHIWDRTLCASQIQKLASCDPTLEGNVMSWCNTQMILMDNVELGTDLNMCLNLQCN